jgi:predicted phage terminase large subunit-like protein
VAKIIMASYSHGLISKHSRDAREIMRSPNYQATFPEALLSRDAQAVEAWDTAAGGRVVASGREGMVTGNPADLIVADDLLSGREEAESPTILEKVWDFWTSGLISRVNIGTRIVLIGTRWSTGDPIGRVLSGPGAGSWTVVHLPAVAEEGDILGRPVGAALWPKLHPIELLESKRLDIGEHEFQSLYQGRPFARGGQYIRRGWFGEVALKDLPPDLVWTRGLDLAVSAKKTADYSASVRVARLANTVFLADGWFRRAEWPTIKRLVVERAKAERSRLAVEAVAGFDVAYRELTDALAGVCVVSKINATRDKLTRALPWIAAAEGGRVVLVRTGYPDRDAWIGEFLAQSESFPAAGVHDDLIDAVSIAYEADAKCSGVQISFSVDRAWVA